MPGSLPKKLMRDPIAASGAPHSSPIYLICLVVRCAGPCTRAARYAFFNKLLAAILMAGVTNYGQLMGDDEPQTVRTLPSSSPLCPEARVRTTAYERMCECPVMAEAV